MTDVENRTRTVRGHRVMLSGDLARLYDVPPKALMQAVKRNLRRFPEDFMFQLTGPEADALGLRSQIVTLRQGGHLKYLPHAFTEQGVAMLASVLRSPRAIRVNIEIVRAFVRMRRWMLSHGDLVRRLDELEHPYDDRFRAVFDAIRGLMEPPDPSPGPRIGFRPE